MAVRQRISVEEYLALPEEKPYLEYIDGEAVPKSMPDKPHVLLTSEFDYALVAYRRVFGGLSGPEGRVEFEGDVEWVFRLPDLGYWAPGREVDGHLALLPPTLAIEIRSPDDTMASQRRKCRYYRDHGVDVCWLADPVSRTVEVFEDDRDADVLRAGDVLRSKYLPGFELAVSELFAILG
jgi:Uma2 family endonuclease